MPDETEERFGSPVNSMLNYDNHIRNAGYVSQFASGTESVFSEDLGFTQVETDAAKKRIHLERKKTQEKKPKFLTNLDKLPMPLTSGQEKLVRKNLRRMGELKSTDSDVFRLNSSGPKTFNLEDMKAQLILQAKLEGKDVDASEFLSGKGDAGNDDLSKTVSVDSAHTGEAVTPPIVSPISGMSPEKNPVQTLQID